MKKNRPESLSGRVVELARRGDGVVDTREGRIHVPGVAPGDHVELVIAKREGRVLHGRAIRVLDEGASRVEAPCPLVERCGGCPWMHVSIEAQREAKRKFLASALPRDGVREGVVPTLVAVGPALRYRRRARLAFERRGDTTRVGYRSRRSNDLVDVETCLVLANPLAEALTDVRSSLASHLEGRGEILLAQSGTRAVVAVRSDDAQPSSVFDAASKLVGPNVAGVAIRAGGATRDAVFGDPRERIARRDGTELLGTIGGFSQANDEVNERLVSTVAELADTTNARVLELYAGHGNLTMALAPGASSYVAVELDGQAADACRENLATAGVSARVFARDAADAPAGEVDVVVLDPPRTGAADAMPRVLGARPKRIVYVSCDPGTLGRDLRTLVAAGYVIDAAVAFDMFPSTPHVESVVRLVAAPALAPATPGR